MDELNRIASAYFNAFEGRRHYPRFVSWQWALCAITFALWMLSAWYFFDGLRRMQASSIAVIFAMEFLFIATTFVIENHKRRSLLSSRSSIGTSTNDQLDALRKVHLSKAFGRGPEQFAAIASESMALVSMAERLRAHSGTLLSRLWRYVYDADHKDRLVGVVVGSAAILVSLVIVGLPEESPSVIELAASKDFVPAMNLLFVFTAMGFGLWLAAAFVIRSALTMSSFWAARLTSKTGFLQMKVRYMLMDLVRLHQPVVPTARRRLTRKESQNRHR